MTTHRAPSPMVAGARLAVATAGIWTRIAWLALRCYRGPVRAGAAIRRLLALRQGPGPAKLARAGNRYFWSFYAPGWPSLAFDRFIEHELNRLVPFRASPPALQTLVFAITKRCPLRCEHCCEWAARNQPDTLSSDAIHDVLARFQSRGVSQVLLSGGEPLQRFDDLVRVLEATSTGTDFWILTSGYGLTPDKARRLRRAGLTGVAISLDHWNPEAHDRFRGLAGSFDWVKRAAAGSRRAGLLLALSLCPTRDFVSRENLQEYARIARRLGAAFVQILEPRPVGRYAGQDVHLDAARISLLEEFQLRLNTDRDCRKMPAVAYVDRARRLGGCSGAGDRYLYVDTDGTAHPCPFCRTPAGSVPGCALRTALADPWTDGCRTS